MTEQSDGKTGRTDQLNRARTSLREVPSGTLAATIRALMPDILARLDDGAQYQDIVEALGEAGIKISRKTLTIYVYRYRQKSKKSEAGGGRKQPKMGGGNLPPGSPPPLPLGRRCRRKHSRTCSIRKNRRNMPNSF